MLFVGCCGEFLTHSRPPRESIMFSCLLHFKNVLFIYASCEALQRAGRPRAGLEPLWTWWRPTFELTLFFKGCFIKNPHQREPFALQLYLSLVRLNKDPAFGSVVVLNCHEF